MTNGPAPLGPGFHEGARARLRARAEAAGLDGLLLLRAPNLAYATGLHLSANERPMGLWLPVAGEPVLMLPALEAENAGGAVAELRLYEEFPGEVPPVLWMLSGIGRRAVGIDALDARLLDAAREATARLDLTDHAMAARAVKEPEEIALVTEAARFADLVLERLHERAADMIRQGAGERDLMDDATGHARAALAAAHGAAFGAAPMGITASVHAGPRAALPHGATGARVPRPGETLIAGIGASLGGYHAESGATFVLGAPDADQRRVMAAMLRCRDAAVEACAAGASCTAVNDQALGELRAAGLGDAIRHRIGHGMGLEGHEAPWLAPGDDTITAPGMVFSNEPGVYRPGHDGWRTIDTMIVTPSGVDIPSRFGAYVPAENRVIAI